MVTTKNNGQNGRSLPEGWEWMELGNLVSFVGSGVTPKGGKNVYLKEGIPFIRSQNVYPDGLRLEDVAYVTKELHAEMNRTHIRAGDVLLNITGASIGRSTFVPESLGEANVNQHVCILRPLNIITPKFLSAFLNSNNGQDQIMEAQSGVTRQGLNYTQVRALQIPVPPLPEQERIVNRIEELFSDLEAGVAALERSRAGLRRYKASVLKAAVEGKLLESSGELLRGWRRATLSEVTTQIKDADHKMPKPADTDIPYVSTKDFVGDDNIDFENAKHISEEDYKALTRKIKPELGDILLSRYGTVGQIRKVKSDRPFQASYSIAIVKPLASEVLTDFLVILLRSEIGQQQMRDNIRASSQPDLGLESIRKFVVPLPPLDEQRRIVAEVERRLSVVGEVESAVDAGLVRAGRLRQSVLRSAFEGRL